MLAPQAVSVCTLTSTTYVPCRFFYASSACIYPEGKQLNTEVEGGGLKEGDAWPAQPQVRSLLSFGAMLHQPVLSVSYAQARRACSSCLACMCLTSRACQGFGAGASGVDLCDHGVSPASTQAAFSEAQGHAGCVWAGEAGNGRAMHAL